MRFKERKVKRIYAFVLMFIIVFQSVLGLDQRYLVNGATMDVEDSGESYYTVYFSASEILEQDSFIQNGVYLYAYDTDSDGTEVKGLEQPVQMTESELGENLYEYRLDNPYTIVEFMLGDSVDEAIKSDPINVDWMNYSKPCFTMELATENSSESGVIDGAASATSVKLQVLDITDLKNLEQAATLSDEENLESGSDSETDSESENDSESSSVPETLSEDEEAEVSAVSFTPNSNYLYLNPAGMNLGNEDWANAEKVWLYVKTWVNNNNVGWVEGKKDSNGYWYWDSSTWQNSTDNWFFFALTYEWNKIKGNNYYRTGTSGSINLKDAIGKVFVASGTNSTIDNQLVYDITESLEGQTIYFADYTSSTTSVSAVFSNDSSFSNSTSVKMTGKANGLSELYSVVIPGAQKYVKFVDASDNQLGDIYNIYGGTENSVNFATGSNDTYHYGITEKSGSQKISRWGAVPVGNTSSLAGKTLYFDNKSFTTSLSCNFQIGTNAEVSISVDSNSQMFAYTFPEDTDATHQTILTIISNGTEYHFTWNDTTYNKVTMTESVAGVNAKYIPAQTVYFDATLSKLNYTDDGNEFDCEIPESDHQMVYYYAIGDEKQPITGNTMTKVDSYSGGTNTWSDVYKVDLPEGYDQIIFASFGDVSTSNYGGHGESTDLLTIPVGLSRPCFYADTSDSVAYDGGTRGGYWAEVYTVRDAESGKGTDVVDIDKETFESGTGTLYVNSTFYDYYTDYELNGKNRDNYKEDNAISYRNWVTFRQFNQALSDYYKSNKVSIPIYTGHFQPSISGWGCQFSGISSDLELFGYDSYDKFFSTNNSNLNIYGNEVDTSSVAQGLVSSSMSDDSLMIATSEGVVNEPHFDEDFLTGNNSKNAVLGEVYQDVAFPFVQKDIGTNGVKYWYFNSSDTTLAMKQDTITNAYYLKNVGEKDWSLNVDSESKSTGVRGFFPFNETITATPATPATCATKYNYGFGVKLEFQFRLTEDGTVLDSSKNKVPITFEFSGDDDVWVFIDGQLVLDVGGAHGIATGKIDFQSKKATVDKVKASAGSTTSGSNVEKSFSLVGNNEEEHTLTMYYMERGMWESNMMITFNFPDENQLEVEKQVDETDVNELFKGLFDDKSLFTYTIKNQATHYGAKEVSTGEATLPQTFYSSSNDGILNSVSGNTFETSTSLNEQSDLIHWYAKLEDKTGSWRDQRYGTITSTSSGGIDISNMSYLQFKFYYDYNDTPSFSNMYLQLVDKNEKIKGNITDYLSSKTYGIIPLSGKKWITIKINLSDLEEQSGFDKTSVTKIKFGYNYPRNIYLDDFIFYPSVVSSELVGFITKQYDIPDYGSAASGKLEIPKGAVYSSSTGENRAIAEDGTFVLKNNETVTFSDQFRRGSYIYLEEEENDLFQTSWTMYDNGMAVTSFGTGKNVLNGTSISSMKNVSSTVVNDDRTEQVLDGAEEDSTETNAVKNTGYTEAKQPTDAETFVFRSYNNPDDVTTTTKLKIVYTNKVKTGSLMIHKKSLYDGENLDGEYTFHVTFYNVGGIGLESSSIKTSFTLKAGKSYKIEGIPLGTCYSIQEEVPTDSSHLGNVKISNLSAMMIDTSSMTVQGVITEKADYVTFYNTLEPKISASVTKLWKDEVTDKDLQSNLPDSIYVQLQRKQSTQNDDDDYAAVVLEGGMDYSRIEIVPSYGENGDVLWEYTVSGLDKIVDYKNNPRNTTEWVYRFVELDKDGNVVENGKILTLTTDSGEEDFRSDYATTQSNSGDYTTTITNTLLGSVNLHIIKTSAENDERLPGVKFQLEKWNQSNGTYDKIGEKTTSENSNNDLTTGGETLFEGLENGTYRLTELQTAEGYTLLKSPVIVTINRKTDTYSYQMENEDESSLKELELTYVNGVPTLTLSIKNTTNMTLPQTGVRVPVQGVAAGALLCLLAGIMYMIESKRRRKEGKGLLNNNMYSRQDNWASGVMEKKKERNEKMKKQSKIKRIVTALLALVLTVSMLPVQTGMTAFADTQNPKPTIDLTGQTTGSLTIHKYEYNGTDGNQGTGSESDTVPNPSGEDNDPKALAGVTFKVTWVYKINDNSNYYTGEEITLPTVSEAQGIAKDKANNNQTEANSFTAIGNWQEQTTGVDGKITFSDLPIGIYLVEETKAPAQITSKTEAFLVSIPTTNAEGSGWNYDVHVFPKNKSTYAGVTLIKQGKWGNDENETAPLQGVTFVLQKKVDEDTWEIVKKDNKGNAINGITDDNNETTGVLTTNADGKISVADLAPGEYRFVEMSVPENTGYIMDGETTYDFTIADGTVEGKDAGTIWVGDTQIYESGDNTGEFIINTVTNYKPDVEKEVCTGTDENDKKTWDNASDYSVGDTVPYRIKVDVPENVAKLRTFTISDTMENLTFNEDSLKICSDADCESEILLDSNGDDKYTVNTTANYGWSIEFNYYDGSADPTSILEDYAGQNIYIYFEAELNTTAITNSDGNDNTVSLSYSNKIIPTTNDGNPNKEDDEPENNKIIDQATVYTFKIAIEKYGEDENSDGNKDPLSGVVFILYRQLSTNSNDNNGQLVDGLDGRYESVATLTTDANGKISSSGLKNGTYYLVETKTNSGYNLLKKPVEVLIEVEYVVTTITTESTDDNGVTTIETQVVATEFNNSGDVDEITVEWIENYQVERVDRTMGIGVFTQKIYNNKGFQLPTTGGIGTYIFFIVGISMMAAAVILFVRSKKKEDVK